MNIDHEVATLKRLTVSQLHTRYSKIFGETPRSRHRDWLIRRIVWRRQANHEGGISERARLRALELANDADLRVTAPGGQSGSSYKRIATDRSRFLDDRLPISGTQLTRVYKGRTLVVKVLSHGFEFDGQVFPSLSAITKAVTGSHWNGFHFFRLTKQKANG